MHRVQSLKAGEHFDAKNWAFDAKFAKIERGQNCCRKFSGKHSAFLVTIIIGYNATNTGNNVASLHYNNSNRTDVAIPAGCCDDAEARRKTQRKTVNHSTVRISFYFNSKNK